MSLILRAAASESGTAQIADTTAMQSAPDFTTSLTLDSLIPPIATKGCLLKAFILDRKSVV
jgi:hypothetical protein